MSMQLKKLRDGRIERNLTQKQLADIVGISESYYCQLENGVRRMSLPVAQKIAIALNMGLDELFLPSSLAYRKAINDQAATLDHESA